MANSEVDTTACANCMKPGTKSFCAGCNGAPDRESRPQKTAYCNSSCQKTHWQAHKGACLASRQRKMLFRAGDIAQQLFYTFRRELFDKSFKAVKREGCDIILYDDVYEAGDDLSPAKAMETCLVPFPDDLFSEKYDREAVLAYNACTDVLMFLHIPLSFMLKGISTQIQEQELHVKNQKRHIKLIFPNGIPNSTLFRHQLLQVKLKCGELYAFDISAAQYGYYEPVVPWESYVNTRVKEIKRTSPFGQAGREEDNYTPPTGWGKAIWRMNKWWSVKVAHYMSNHEAKIPMAKMLKLPDNEFRVAQENFFEGLDDFLKNLKTFRDQGAFAFFKTQIADQAMTLSPSEWEEQREIWESRRPTKLVFGV